MRIFVIIIGIIAEFIVAIYNIKGWKNFRRGRKWIFGAMLIVLPTLTTVALDIIPNFVIREELVLQLADKSMMNRNIWEWDAWDGGDAASYDRLIEIANDKHNHKLKEFVQKEIERVQQSYSDSDILVRRIRLDGKNEKGEWIFNEDNTTEYLIAFLHSKQNVLKTYARAAQLLESRKSKKVLDELVYVMKNNPSLLIRKIALDSFTKMAVPLGFKQNESDLLNFNPVIDFWESNGSKKEIIKRLEN